MKISQILTLLFGILIIGCNETAEKTPGTTAEKHTVQKQQLSDWKADIELDGGSKWIANPETTEGIEKMQQLVENSAPATPEDFRSLGDQLNDEKNLLLKQCTMKGSAHNNLHIYLQPLMGRIGELQEVESAERGKELIAEIQEHLKAYYNYFS